jgi:hypothetical protein
VIRLLREQSASGTLVTVTHSGWSAIRPDHPARHGEVADAFLRGTGLWSADPMTSLRRHVEPACAHLPAPAPET